MIRRYVIFILAIALLYACGKEDADTLPSPGGQLFAISGKLLIQSPYDNAAVLREMAGQKVAIRVDTGARKDTSNYFYAVVSGANGGFSFYVADTTLPYEVFCMTAYKSSPAYSLNYYGAARTTVPFGNNTTLQLVMSPDTISQNGIDLTTIDAAGNRAGRASIALYTSQAIASSDAEVLSGNGSLVMAVTDSMGRAFVANLPPDRLYMNARIISGTDTFLTVAKPILVPARQLVTDTLILIKK